LSTKIIQHQTACICMSRERRTAWRCWRSWVCCNRKEQYTAWLYDDDKIKNTGNDFSSVSW